MGTTEGSDQVGDGDGSPRRRRQPTIVGLVLSILLWGVAVVATGLLLADLAAPTTACDRLIPLFEGIEVERAEASWAPPLITCTWVDRDPGQLGEISTDTIWDAPEVAVVVALDVLAVADVVRRLRARRRRRAAARELRFGRPPVLGDPSR